MLVPMLFSLMFFNTAICSYLSKQISNISDTACKIGIYMVASGLFGMFNFWAMGGFSVISSRSNIYFGLLFAVGVALTTIVEIIVLRYTTVAFNLIFTGAFSLIAGQILGMVIFDEAFSIINILRCVLRIASAIIAMMPFSINVKQKKFVKAVFLCSLSVIIRTFVIYVTKAGALHEGIDTNSWFFFTNAFSMLFGLGYLFFGSIFCDFELVNDFKSFRSRGILLGLLTTLFANIGSLVEVRLMAIVAVSYYSPVSSAITMISTFFVSKIILREHASKYIYLAVALSVIAVIM